MTLITVSAGGPDIADGTYPMVLTKIEGPKTIVPQRGPNAGQDVEIYEWTFETSDGVEIQESSSTSSGPRSKLYGWLTALLGGQAPAPKQQFGPDDLVGRWALGQVRRDPPETGWPKIVQLMPMPAQMAQQQFARATGAPVQGAPAPVAAPPATQAPAAATEGQFVAAPIPQVPQAAQPPQDDLPF